MNEVSEHDLNTRFVMVTEPKGWLKPCDMEGVTGVHDRHADVFAWGAEPEDVEMLASGNSGVSDYFWCDRLGREVVHDDYGGLLHHQRGLLDRPVFMHSRREATPWLYDWHFVYFHGEAEGLNNIAWADNSHIFEAPDICQCTYPIEQFLNNKESLESTGIAIPCLFLTHSQELLDAVVVLRKKGNLVKGRIGLIRDVKGTSHVYDVEHWM